MASDVDLSDKFYSDLGRQSLYPAFEAALRWPIVGRPIRQERSHEPYPIATTLCQHPQEFLKLAVGDKTQSPSVVKGPCDATRVLGTGQQKDRQSR